MRIYRLPAATRAILFDIDGTLYTNAEYGRRQIDVLIEELARVRGQDIDQTRADVEKARATIAGRDGVQTSLGNAMAALGVDLPTSVAWRERLIDPAAFLSPDARLRAALGSFVEAGIRLVAVTNNPKSVGLASIRALGVDGLFSAVVGLDDTLRSKPAREPYELAARRAEAPPETCLSAGDRYDVDLAVPLDLGMGAVLVDGVEDVYALPEILSKA